MNRVHFFCSLFAILLFVANANALDIGGSGSLNGSFEGIDSCGTAWWGSSASEDDKNVLFSVRCVYDSLTTPVRVPTKSDLNLSVAISNGYLEIWVRGGSMQKIFYKEMWTFQCKNDRNTITYDPKIINSSNPPKCQGGKLKNINLWTLLKEGEKDPGKVQMSVYSKSDSAYLDGNNDFITTLESIKPGATVATLAESSNRKLACGQSLPGAEDICIGGKPAVKLRPRSAYDELAKILIMIHYRFIDSPDSDSITIVTIDSVSNKIITSVMDRAKAAGFYKINRAKATEFHKVNRDIAAYNLMKDKNFAKCADSVLKKVGYLQISDCHAEDDPNDIATKTKGSLIYPSARDIDMGSGDGSRSKQEIMQVMNARMPGLRNTYNTYLKLKPGFSGKVVLKFTIAPSGDIISIAIVSSTTNYSDFDNAVKNMVATWKWKVIKSGNTTPTIPFNFTE